MDCTLILMLCNKILKSTMFVPSRPKNKRQKKEEILWRNQNVPGPSLRPGSGEPKQGQWKKTDSMNSRKKCETTQKDFPNPYNPTIRFWIPIGYNPNIIYYWFVYIFGQVMLADEFGIGWGAGRWLILIIIICIISLWWRTRFFL